MPIPFRRPLLPYFALLSLLLAACGGNEKPAQPSADFIPYIPAFTAGHISARAPILVRLADGAHLKDTTEAALQKLFDLSPGAPGTVSWYDAHTLQYRPRERMKQATTYYVTFHLGQLMDVPENLNDFTFGITTYAQDIGLKVTDLQSLSPTDLTWQRVVVSVFTGDDATGQDLAGCVTATQGGRPLKMTWEHEPGGTLHRAVADSIRRGEQASSVEFTWDARKIGGTGSGHLSFTVPAIGDLRLISSEVSTTGEQVVSLLFSDPLDPAQDLSGLAGIAGADHVRLAIDGHKLMLWPQDRLTGDQTAFVAAGLKNVNGRPLGKDVNVDLVFEEVKPNVRAVGSGTILPGTDGLLFPFEAVNLSAVGVRIVRIYADNVPQFLQVNDLDGERELARVGRLVLRKVVPLEAKEAAKPGSWNRYYLDLDKLIKAEPGAIYRVSIGFRQAYSTYPCGGTTTKPQLLAPLPDADADNAQWDEPQNYYYDEGFDEYNSGGDYDWKERDNPCSASYFHNKGSVVERNILASNIGVIAMRGNDGSMTIAVSDLRTTAPIAHAHVEVLDLQQRKLFSGHTGADGLLQVKSTAHKPFLAVVTKGKETGYLKLDGGDALSMSEFDTQGEAVDKGLKGFIYGERGVWRPGDTLHLTFILGKTKQDLPKDIPVSLELTDPLGRLTQRQTHTSGLDGMYAFTCTTRADAPTGVWGARVVVGGTSFHKAVRIETVKPNRLKILLDLGGERLTANDSVRAQLQSNWLHGAPAKDLKAKVTVTLTRSSAHFKGFDKYGFDDLNSDLSTEEFPVYDGQLDVKGHASFPFNLHLNARAPAAVKANVVSRVFEPGGNASTDRTDVQYYPYTSYAGLRVPPSTNYWGTWSTDTTYMLGAVALSADGRPLPQHTLRAQVYKVSYNWWWSGDMDEPSNYMNAPSSRIISDTTIITGTDGTARVPFRVDRPQWGRFVVRLSDPASGHASAQQLYLDWPGYAGRSRRQDSKAAAMLRFNSDKEKYAPGDHCTITFPSAGQGHALVSLENGSRVLRTEWIKLKQKETQYSFAVTADMAPNIYAHVTLVQPHALTAPDSTGAANDLPIRLYGVIPIPVEDPATHITPVITTAKAFKTDRPFTVEVAEKDGKAMTYTLAIVDEGLLDLTRFKTPDPWHHFYAREALGVRTWDLYDEVIGAFGRRLRRILAIGGSDQASPAEAAKAQRFKPVVRFAGPFRLAKGKTAKHTFTISNYVGSVRVMVVACTSEAAYGSAEKAVPVRKPLMLLATLPRVTGPGETVDLPVTVFAMDPKVKEVKLGLAANDLFTIEGSADQHLTFTSTGEQLATFRLKVKDRIGVGKVTVTATGAGEEATQKIEIDVRQAGLPETEAGQHVVEAGQHWEAAPQPLGVAGTNSVYLELSTLPPIDLGRRLQYLIDYLHGCIEQTTSKAFPQLFLADVMDMDDKTVAEMRGNVEAGLRRLTRFQRPNGGFSYWPGGHDISEWASVYAGHFMIEAERKGFVLPPGLKDNWLAYARREARDWTMGRYEGWSSDRSEYVQAYRLYVLALANSAESGAMNRLRTTPGLGRMAQWMLAAAYALNNRADVAHGMVKGLSTGVAPYRELGFTYGSGLRDEAVIAEALLRTGDKPGAAGLVLNIAKEINSDAWFSTQSTAWALLAVSRVEAGQTPDKAMHFNVSINGAKAQERMSEKAVVRIDLPVPDGKKKVRVSNTGQGLLYVRLVRTGTPIAGKEQPSANGLAMDAHYETMDGKWLDPAALTQGTDFQAVVTVRNTGTRGVYRNLALTQVFPSGWEIRNSRLEGTESALANSPYDHQDIRDDRVLTYFDLGAGGKATYRVLLNASYTGRFHLPSTVCSAMYDNTINARSGGRWVEVVVPGKGTAAR